MEVSSPSKPMNITRDIDHQEMEERKGGGGSSTTSLRSCDFIVLRFLAFITTLIAFIVMVVSNETKMVPIVVLPNLPPLTVEAVAKWQHLSAFRFYLASNIIACVYAALSLILSIVVRSSSKGFGLMIFIFDLIVVNLLFSSIGAAAAIGLLGYQGNSYVRWNKVCNVFGSFCRHNAISTVMSLIGSTMFVFILMLLISKLHNNNRSRC